MKTENLPTGTSQSQTKYVALQEAVASEPARDGKSPRLTVGDVISVRVEQVLGDGRAMVNFQGTRFSALTQIALKQGEMFNALIESLSPEIRLKPLVSQTKLLEAKLNAEVKTLLGDKENSSETMKWVRNLVAEAKGTPTSERNPLFVPKGGAAVLQSPETTSILKNAAIAAKEGEAALNAAATATGKPFPLGLSNAFTQARYLDNAVESIPKPGKPLDLAALLSNEKAALLLRNNATALGSVMERTILTPENATSKEALLNLMRDSGLQLERKVADLLREGGNKDFPKLVERDLKGQLLKLKGELAELAQDKALPQNIRDEIASLQKEVGSRINNIELNQLLNSASREKDASMIFQIPFMQNEEIRNSVLEYKRRKSKSKDEPDELAISFFLEMSNIGNLRIDGILQRKSFNGVINVTSDEAATAFRKNIGSLTNSISGYGIAANLTVRKVESQGVKPPDNTDFLKSDAFRDSLLDIKA